MQWLITIDVYDINVKLLTQLACKNEKCNVTFNETSEAQRSTIVHTERNMRVRF